jgi:EAL and modified HD-GYP domain-containing signal transduction protein
MDSTETAGHLPLISLQPIADAQHAWVAMLLCAAPPPSANDLAHLFDQLALADALDGLPCVVAVTDPKDWDEACGQPQADSPVLRLPAVAADAELPVSAEALARWPDIARLALGVDRGESFERCQKAGFTWFAGNYPLHPAPGTVSHNAAHHALALQLLTLITHDADNRDIEQLVKRDVNLSYQLLRLVNSAAFSLNHRISSFNQAITILGRQQLQRWLQLLIYARPDGAGRSPLLPRAAFRAALMEALVPRERTSARDRAFMAGMFSLLDVMLNDRMAKILASLHLSEEISQALLERSGHLGAALRAVEIAESALQDANDNALAAALAEAGISQATWTQALVQACHWAVRVSREA